MSTSDAFVIGESWLSEHFFTTDARSRSFQAKVIERRTAWDADGGGATPRSRFLAQRSELQRQMADLSQLVESLAEEAVADDRPLDVRELSDAADELSDLIVTVLGLDQHGLQRTGEGPLSRFAAPGMEGAGPLALITALPVTSVDDLLAKNGLTLRSPVSLAEDGEATRSVARLLSWVFVADDAPAFALVLAGRWALLAEKERWAEGRYLAVDLQTVAERNATAKGGEIDKALTCLAAESVAPDADGGIWWSGVLEESVKHTVGVSKELREGVRLSIEIIANDVVERRRQQGLDQLPADQAQPLAKQALRYLYRILFLLYAEASPELDVLPVGAPEYDAGYSLDRLREVTQVALTSERAERGTHLYDSLAVLFRLVDEGHPATDEGLRFSPLRADLFRPEATALIDGTGLSSAALQKVLAHLLLSKEKRGADRGYISYAELGINQLGAVYEGLMSYTGFFAETDLYEVAKNGDSSKGSWVVPVGRADGIASTDFVRAEDVHTGEMKSVVHRQGTFVFRLSGRDRQQSASYYTPEVLTRFTVGQAIEELLDQDGTRTPAADLLTMSVCEPALGSGAFAIEAVRQLAEQYLERRQKELGQQIDPDAYPKELQKAKAYIALHNVYGVDLNATAVELAEISLWLDTMVTGLDAPWFGLHLRRGNSLIGARRAVYERHQVNDKSWLTTTPRDVPLTSMVDDMTAERVGGGIDGALHHFLLPAEGWGAAADAKEAAALAPDAAKALKAWRKSLRVKPTRQQLDDLAEIAHRVEVLWQMALRRLQIAEQQIRRSIDVWGADDLPARGSVTREQIEASVADEDGAYRRLRRVMDAWSALWFWPLTEDACRVVRDGVAKTATPPTLGAWIAALQGLVGRAPDLRKRKLAGNLTLATATSWGALEEAEVLELNFAGARPVANVIEGHPWLEVCEREAGRQGFFHWHLDFGKVFALGGFDLQVGNPPWVRPESDPSATLAEFDPWWKLVDNPTQAEQDSKRSLAIACKPVVDALVMNESLIQCARSHLGNAAYYPSLEGLRPNLYRNFMEKTWGNASRRGSIALIHPESHFTDEAAGALRETVYKRLRRHWHFQNQLKYFEIQNEKFYGISVYGRAQDSVSFLQAAWLYTPETVERSLVHSGAGTEPGLKTPSGDWNLEPHRSRIVRITWNSLKTWKTVLEYPHSSVRTPMLYLINRAVSDTLEKMAKGNRIASLNPSFSAGWNQTTDSRDGVFDRDWGSAPNWREVILQGPSLGVSNPFFQQPNASMRNQRDWVSVDLESLQPWTVPTTCFRRLIPRDAYDAAYDSWTSSAGPSKAHSHYRIAWRNQAANTGSRTLIAAIIPPGATHVDGIFSMGSPTFSALQLASQAGLLSTLFADFCVRAAPKSNIRAKTLLRLPLLSDGPIERLVALRALRLNCLTEAYADLYNEAYHVEFASDAWTTPGMDAPLAPNGPHWDATSGLRRARERRQAQLEIDALVALSLGVSASELCAVYRAQFPVLHQYDTKDVHYDRNGRIVPTGVVQIWRRHGNQMVEAERTAVHPGSGIAYTYDLPFATLDREADMRAAYAEFERRLRERGGA